MPAIQKVCSTLINNPNVNHKAVEEFVVLPLGRPKCSKNHGVWMRTQKRTDNNLILIVTKACNCKTGKKTYCDNPVAVNVVFTDKNGRPTNLVSNIWIRGTGKKSPEEILKEIQSSDPVSKFDGTAFKFTELDRELAGMAGRNKTEFYPTPEEQGSIDYRNPKYILHEERMRYFRVS